MSEREFLVLYLVQNLLHILSFEPGIGRKKLRYGVSIFDVINKVCDRDTTAFDELVFGCHKYILLHLYNDGEDHGAAVSLVEQESLESI